MTTIQEIDWGKLKSYDGKTHKSFEELCYQIARRLHEDKGEFTTVDDSGGGDGVEFYLTLPDGSQWGWQAKFYYPNLRLRESSRKTSIKTSLKRALEKHPKLTKWFLCTPTNFTPEEQKWFDKTLIKVLKRRKVKLIHCGNREFNGFLGFPKMVGIRNYFFGELELTPEWFSQKFKKQLAIVEEKFIPGVHTETDADFVAHCLLGDRSFVESISKDREWLLENFKEFQASAERIRDLKIPELLDINLNEFFEVANNFSKETKNVVENLARFLDFNAKGSISEARKFELDSDFNSIQAFRDAYRNCYNNVYDLVERTVEQSPAEGKKTTKDKLDPLLTTLSKPLSSMDDVLQSVGKIGIDIDWFKRSELPIFGDAGLGKTHIVCHLCEERIEKDLPAILLHGKQFKSGDVIEQKIREILDISYSWADFIAALQSYAEAWGTKILITIDALNEAQNIDTWEDGLFGFIKELSSYPRLVLVTTCRTSYQDAIWGKHRLPNYIYLSEFGGIELEELLAKYFEYYKLKTDPTPVVQEQFSNPLYLRIFCEAENGERQNEKHVHLGQQTLFEVFDKFLEVTNKKICQKFSKPETSGIIQQKLQLLAKELWERNSRDLPFSEVTSLFDGKTPHEIDWDNSFTRALLDEGLLVKRDWAQQGEVVSFTYDLLGGYLISKVIFEYPIPEKSRSFLELKKLPKRLTVKDAHERSFLSCWIFKSKYKLFKEWARRIINKEFRNLHPLHEDILRCLCALFPEKTGNHLYQLSRNRKVFGYSIDALFEMKPKYITQAQKDYLRYLFADTPSNRKPLFILVRRTAFNVGHPLNMDFLDDLLNCLSMPERDLSWSELLRRSLEPFGARLLTPMKDTESLEHICKEKPPETELGRARIHLFARYVRWMLTSTHRLLRDKATRALYWYGRSYPEKLFELTLESLKINDPYVPERMLAASYGVAMALHADPEYKDFVTGALPKYAREIFKKMFAKEAPHSTTHALRRDYARRTIDLALLHNPRLLNSREKKLIKPPFKEGGIREWGKEDVEPHFMSDGILDYDFVKNELKPLVPYRKDRGKENEEFREIVGNIRWRIHELGYSEDLFEKIDIEISRGNWPGAYRASGNEGRIDRYGEKYSWIAYFELFGFRKDRGLFEGMWFNHEPRPSAVDIDPSFPDRPHNIRIATFDFLSSHPKDLREWIEEGGIPEFSPLFVIKELNGEKGSWILLDGYVCQKDERTGRYYFSFLKGFLLSEQRIKTFISLFKSGNPLHGSSSLKIPEDHYTFAGEVPWCNSFSKNGIDTLEYSSIKAPKSDIWGYPIKDKSISVLVPVRYNSWEFYHSMVNPGQSVEVPAREISEEFGLWIKLPKWDMYDKEGKIASISTDWGESFKNHQTFVYLRKDLFDEYLKKHGMKIVWIVWGEREIRSDERWDYEKKGFPAYRKFYKVYTYERGKAKLVKN